ncbi:UNVERIFIED_CONTAM: hypothetical protein FKN15_036218 [Acipenser sinensis]
MVSHTISAQIFLSFPTIPSRISTCLSAISSWMHSHHLKLNLSKSDLLFFPSCSPSSDLSISVPLESTTLSPSSSANSLGVTLDPCLFYSQHISTLACTCRFFLSNIRRIRPFLNNYATQLLVQAFVLSHLDYCNSWLSSLRPPPVRSSSSRTPLLAWCSLCLASPMQLHYSAHSTSSRSPLASSSRLLY